MMFLRFITKRTLKNECCATSSHHQPYAVMPSSLMIDLLCIFILLLIAGVSYRA